MSEWSIRASTILGIAARLIARAGWAPFAMFLLHGFFSRVINVYRRYPLIDIPMHFFGGVAIAYFFSSCFAALSEDAVSRRLRPLAQFVFVFCLTATAAVFWEFGEYTSDTIFRTNALDDVYDTLQDIALGISGGAFYMLIAWWRGKLGLVRPVTETKV